MDLARGLREVDLISQVDLIGKLGRADLISKVDLIGASGREDLISKVDLISGRDCCELAWVDLIVKVMLDCANACQRLRTDMVILK